MDLDIKVEFLENGTQMPEADSTKVSLTRLSYSFGTLELRNCRPNYMMGNYMTGIAGFELLKKYFLH